MLFMNPVNSGFITYGELKNGTVNLYDIFVMNEFISYKNDYEAKTSELLERE